MLIHSPCLGRQKQNIDSARSTNEKSMGVRSTSALWQRQGTSGQPLVSQLTPSWGLSLGGSGQGWTPAKTNHTSRTLTENRVGRGTFIFWLRKEIRDSLSVCRSEKITLYWGCVSLLDTIKVSTRTTQ